MIVTIRHIIRTIISIFKQQHATNDDDNTKPTFNESNTFDKHIHDNNYNSTINSNGNSKL
jgi:hypothetical protein